jgi:hypothetical protein
MAGDEQNGNGKTRERVKRLEIDTAVFEARMDGLKEQIQCLDRKVESHLDWHVQQLQVAVNTSAGRWWDVAKLAVGPIIALAIGYLMARGGI